MGYPLVMAYPWNTYGWDMSYRYAWDTLWFTVNGTSRGYEW